MSNTRWLLGLACIAGGIFGAARNWNTHVDESAIAHDTARVTAYVQRKWTDEGHALPVVYSRADPRRSFPEGAGRTSRSNALVGSAISLLVSLIGVAVVLREWRRPQPA